MKTWFLSVLCLACATVGYSQTVQWASSVVEFSSQKTAKANSAAKILGSPNVMPQGGESPDAWEPGDKKKEYIKVRFANPTTIEKVVILENYMPGAITKVFAVDTEGKEYELAAYTTKYSGEPKRILDVVVPSTSYKVNAIKLEINPYLVSDNPQYDAIGIMEKAGPLSLIQLVPGLTIDSKPERLSDEINTKFIEDAPLVSFDEKTLYFSRGKHPQNVGGINDIEDIWMSKMQPDGTWGKPFNAGPPINNKDANFIFSETKEGTTVLLGNIYGRNGTMRPGASTARKTADGKFTQPKALVIKNDVNLNGAVDYVINTRGDILIISEERDNSFGERDLHVSFLQPDSTWSEPVNLGPNVNTASEEFAPFLAPDDRSLFFSTSGRPGYGDVDIFVCQRQGDGWSTWNEPQNLGDLINGPNRDSYFSVPARGEYAYFTKVGGIGSNETDLYRIKFPRNLDSRPKFVSPATEPDQVVSPEPKPAAAKTPAPAIAPADNTAAENAPKGKLPEAPAAMTEMQFEAIQFDFSKAEINDANYPELAKVAAYLKENPKAVIRIAGHTDAVGSDAFNNRLSMRRAKAVLKYLTQQGAPKSCLKAKGYGETKPKADNETDDGRASNRRVEFVIIKL